MQSTLRKPLSGITVLSLAEQYPGPLCTRLLLEMGAEVIQLERPAGGDPQRQATPSLFRSSAIGKKSVALDLKRPAALKAARALAARADVLVEGYRPGVMDRLGLGYEAVRQINPRIVYCSISGFGQDGPYRDVVGHNINYEALSGVMDPFFEPGSRHDYFTSGLPVGDLMAASMAAVCILGALREAERTGLGTYLDVAISDALMLALAPPLTSKLNGGRAWVKRDAGYGIYAAQDGHIAFGVSYEDHFWDALCQAIGLESLCGIRHAERVERYDELREQVGKVLAQRPAQHWLDLFAGTKVPCSRVNRLTDLPGDSHLAARKIFATAIDETGAEFRTVRFPFAPATGSAPIGRVPPLGESTAEVLRAIGLSGAEIADAIG